MLPVKDIVYVDDVSESLLTHAKINFWIMDFSVSLLVALSALFSENFIRRCGSASEAHSGIIRVPDGFYSSQSKDNLSGATSCNSKPSSKSSYLSYFICTALYFLSMTLSVMSMSRNPHIMLFVQHIAVFSVIMLYFRQFTRLAFAAPCAVGFSMLWILSVNTSYRWIVNNVIVAMCTMLTGYIQFQNFAYLQIFMWLAFVYDVYMLAGIHAAQSSSLMSLFSFDSHRDIRNIPTSSSSGWDPCQNLLCTLFQHNSKFELPTVFSVQFGQRNSYVYIGTGDIIIGAFVANFTLAFFKTRKHLFVTVLGFWLSVALLSYVTETPFPALLSIVPLCSTAILVSAVSCRRTVDLLVDLCAEKASHTESKTKEASIV